MHSMTGYGESEFHLSGLTVRIRIKSLNSRFLEIFFYLPEELRWLEPHFDDFIKKKIHRGRIEVYLETSGAIPRQAAIDEVLLQSYRSLAVKLGAKVPEFRDLMFLPGVAAAVTSDLSAYRSKFDFYFAQALIRLQKSRLAEGKRTLAGLRSRLRYLIVYARKARSGTDAGSKQRAASIRQKVFNLLTPGNAPDSKTLLRLGRQLWFENKDEILRHLDTDISEELERIQMHFARLRDLFTSRDPQGKQIEFYLQELQREVNTLTAKTPFNDVNQTGILMKIEIEKMREQARNLE